MTLEALSNLNDSVILNHTSVNPNVSSNNYFLIDNPTQILNTNNQEAQQTTCDKI